jgi:hypothetical protein
MVGATEWDNDYSGPIKGEEFLGQLWDYQVSKKELFHGIS